MSSYHRAKFDAQYDPESRITQYSLICGGYARHVMITDAMLESAPAGFITKIKGDLMSHLLKDIAADIEKELLRSNEPPF